MDVKIESWDDCGVDHSVVEWFYQIEKPLMQFAREYGLTVGKYPKDTHAWYFVFTHPLGGQAFISVNKHGHSKIYVSGVWSVMDYDSGSGWQRTLKSRPPSGLTTVSEELKIALEEVLSWKVEDLPLIFTDNQKHWHPYSTKEEFVAEQNRYPLPKIAE